MIDVPLSSYVYYAKCDLLDVLDELDSISSRLDDECAKSLVSDIYNDVKNAITKLQNIPL